MECEPTAKPDTLQLAVVPEMAVEHSVVAPSRKFTTPVGLAAPLNVAVKVTDVPRSLGLGALTRSSVGAALVNNNRRDCAGAAAMEPLAPSSPAARIARTPHRLPGVAGAACTKVLPLTEQVSGVHTSYVMGAAPVDAVLIADKGMVLFSDHVGSGVPAIPGAKSNC
ncbi:hypothetical protein SDC9_90362 [bioreactor metagenome]|uniref:Uncharacterized protein n=1 Tax=bioreactor metagenome TaxID=1076179 RepID=A0A644ZS27_9ZZZZ